MSIAEAFDLFNPEADKPSEGGFATKTPRLKDE
jgi:hypothetical protein